MSSEEKRDPHFPPEPRYLPADAATNDSTNIRETPPSQYDQWDRAADGPDPRPALPPVQPPPMHEGLFGFLEKKPGETDFGAATLWGVVYFIASFMVCLLFLFLCQVIPVIIVMIGAIAYMMATKQDIAANNGKALTELILMPTMALAQVATIIVSIVALMFTLGWSWPRRVGIKLPSPWHFLLTLLVVPPMILLANGAYAIAKRYLPGLSDTGMPGMEEMVRLFGTWPWFLAVLIIGLGPGLGEELWCRGFLGLGLFGRNGIVVRVLVASFFFGLIHVDPRQGTMAALMGLLLHYVYLTTRSLLMPMLIHFLNNSTSVIAARFETVNLIDQEPEKIPLVLYAGAFLMMAYLLFALYRTHARLKTVNEFEEPMWRPTYPGVEHPPVGCGVIVAYPRPDLIDFSLVAIGTTIFGCTIAWAALYG